MYNLYTPPPENYLRLKILVFVSGRKKLNRKNLLTECREYTGIDWLSEPSEYLALLKYLAESEDRYAGFKRIPDEFRYCKRGGDKKEAKRLRAKILESMKND